MYRSGQESTRESCQQEVSDIAYCLSAQPIRAAMLPCCHGGALFEYRSACAQLKSGGAGL